jgi:hypothetical protein
MVSAQVVLVHMMQAQIASIHIVAQMVLAINVRPQTPDLIAQALVIRRRNAVYRAALALQNIVAVNSIQNMVAYLKQIPVMTARLIVGHLDLRVKKPVLTARIMLEIIAVII